MDIETDHFLVALFGTLAFCPVNVAMASDEVHEMEMLKQRILELESKVDAADKEKETLAAEKAAGESGGG